MQRAGRVQSVGGERSRGGGVMRKPLTHRCPPAVVAMQRGAVPTRLAPAKQAPGPAVRDTPKLPAGCRAARAVFLARGCGSDPDIRILIARKATNAFATNRWIKIIAALPRLRGEMRARSVALVFLAGLVAAQAAREYRTVPG
jgi:hypothetical protein